MSWDKYLPIEGFENLDRFQGETIHAIFKQGDYGIQLDLMWRVDAVELPADTDPKDEYHSYYGLGAGASKTWVVVNEGANIWNADEKVSWTKSSKFGQLVQRCVDLRAPMIDGDLPPTDARAWVGLISVNERIVSTVKIKGQVDEQESAITLPVQILNAGASAPSTAVFNGAAPPPPSMVSVVDFNAHWGANADAWKRYIKSVAGSKSRKIATDTIIADVNCKPDSVLTAAVENGSFWQWAAQADFLKEVDGVLV